MARTIGLIISILAACFAIQTYSIPVKRSATDQEATNDCYGTECYYDPDYLDTSIDVKFPENLTSSIMSALPKFEASQNEIISFQNQTSISQEKTVSLLEKNGEYIENITSALQSHSQEIKDMSSILGKTNGLLDNIATLLTHQLNLQATRTATNCQDTAIKTLGKSSLYVITPSDGLGSLYVYCDMESNSGGWTVFQKRFDGSLDFNNNWTDYKNGFGRSDGEYWLGLKNIRRLLSDGRNWTLRIDVETFDGEKAYAEYESFMIGDAASNYVLSVGTYSGTAGDALNEVYGITNNRHNGNSFSTIDRDHDDWLKENCASRYRSGWWFGACFRANLNGVYLDPTADEKGIIWYTWKGWNRLKKSEMKIRHE